MSHFLVVFICDMFCYSPVEFPLKAGGGDVRRRGALQGAEHFLVFQFINTVNYLWCFWSHQYLVLFVSLFRMHMQRRRGGGHVAKEVWMFSLFAEAHQFKPQNKQDGWRLWNSAAGGEDAVVFGQRLRVVCSGHGHRGRTDPHIQPLPLLWRPDTQVNQSLLLVLMMRMCQIWNWNRDSINKKGS